MPLDPSLDRYLTNMYVHFMSYRPRFTITSWLEYCAEGLHATLDRVWQRIQRLSASKGMARLVLRPKQEKLLQLMRSSGGLTPREIWDALGISKQGALDLLNPLIEAGLVKRVGTLKSGRYILNP